jgi:hypothetical protein
MTEPAQPPGPARCEMCSEPPSPAGPVLPIGPDGKYVDVGHMGPAYGYTNCFRVAGEEVRAKGAAGEFPARTS